jgi:acyl-homoserine-lactone acylase
MMSGFTCARAEGGLEEGKGASALWAGVQRFCARARLSLQVQRLPLGHQLLQRRLGGRQLVRGQRLRRGAVDLPMIGGTDTLRATTAWDKDQPDDKMRVRHGDSFIMLTRWDKQGQVTSQSIQPYGSATTRPNSKHYTDQMPIFAKQQFKTVYFEWADAVRHAQRRYRP